LINAVLCKFSEVWAVALGIGAIDMIIEPVIAKN
jgi:hypothetical protein